MNTQRPTSYALVVPALLFAFTCLLVGSKIVESDGSSSEVTLQSEGSFSFTRSDKQKGMHFFGRRGLDQSQIAELKRNHIEWLTFVPYGWQADYDSEQVGRRDQDFHRWSRRDSAFARQISWVKEHGFSVMMKPHIWMGDNASGKWRSDINPRGGDAGWKKWSASYRDFILHYARMSEQLKVEMFCIGTELHEPIRRHPEFWKALVVEVRKVFSGKLTYAANWYKEVDDVEFWAQLDYIGVQAYYPLCKETNPSVNALVRGWKPYLSQLEKLHKRYNKPVLFTEIGYKSTPDAAIEPWEWVDRIEEKHRVLSHETQANCYEAFFRSFWHQEWFAGAHFWQWRSGGRRHQHEREQLDFTPQNKQAERVLSEWFSR